MSRAVEQTAKGPIWTPDFNRVHNVVLKLAAGHVAYELSLAPLGPPDEINVLPLIAMPDVDRAVFENAGAGEIGGWPEVGSRAFLRASGAIANQAGPWIVVQSNRYRYSVDQFGGGVRVQMVIGDYLACAAAWNSV